MTELEELEYGNRCAEVFHLKANYQRLRSFLDRIESSHKGPKTLAIDMIRMNSKLERIASMCGNPDPAEACRLILKEIELPEGK